MSDDLAVWTPSGSGGQKEPGLDAVRAKYGPRMVQRFRNWPRLAAVHAEASYADEPIVKAERELGDKNLRRAQRDRDYALAQAEMIARTLDESEPWDVVPTVGQLRREWGFE